MTTAEMVVMLLEGTELFKDYICSTAIIMLVVIFKSNEVLFGRLSYGTLQPHCARMRIECICTQVNYRLLPTCLM